jgi:hypothetical protein
MKKPGISGGLPWDLWGFAMKSDELTMKSDDLP